MHHVCLGNDHLTLGINPSEKRMLVELECGAIFDPTERYRYSLWRAWGDRYHQVIFITLNPSTANETEDDPTVRRCIGFAKDWGYNALEAPIQI